MTEKVVVNKTLTDKIIDLAKAIIGVEFKKLVVILLFLGFIAWLLFEYEIIGNKKEPINIISAKQTEKANE